MINRILSSKVYRAKNLTELDKIYKKKYSFNIKNILRYLLIIENYDKLKKIIDNELPNIKSKKLKEIINYYRCIYFIEKKEKYNADKLYTGLEQKYKIKIDILKSELNIHQLKIFDDKIMPRLNTLKPNLEYGNLLYLLYLSNLLRKEKVVSKIIEIRLMLKINLILLSHSLRLDDIDFLSSVINITNAYYSLKTEYKESFPISLNLLKRIIYKLSTSVILYEQVLNEKIIQYNEIICMGFRTLLSNENEEKNQKQYLEDLKKFIEENKVEEYTKFIFEISNSTIKEEKEKIDAYIDKIEKIVSGSTKGDIIHLIYMCCFFIDESKILNFYTKFKNIQYTGDDIYIIDSLKLGNNLLKFWSGEKIELSFITKSMYVNKFLKLIISLDCEKITYNEFLQKVNELDYIDILSIFSWERMELIFKNYNFEWLEIILKKINPKENNYKFKNYLLNIYVKIINHKKRIFLNEFKKLNNLILLKNKDIEFQIYSIITQLGVYDSYDNDVKIAINNVIENFDNNIVINNSILENFILVTIIYSYRNEVKINVDLMKKIINNNITKNKRILFLIGLYYISDISIDTTEYESNLKAFYKIYEKNDIKDEVEFSMLSHIANIVLREDNILKYNFNDIVYHVDNEVIVLETDYKKEYNAIYKKLNIVKKKSISHEKEIDTLLSILICRTYFSNIEKFNAGKMIQISKELNGEEVINELLKETGYYHRKEQIDKIKNGELIPSLWLNEFNLHTFMKDMKSKIDHKFANSINKLNLNDTKIIHITSLTLLAKLGIVDKLKSSNKYFVTGHIYREIENMYNNPTLDMLDGVIEDAVCYDDYINEIYETLKKLKENKQIKYVSSANILGTREINKFNSFDKEFIKLISTYNSENLFSIITEEPFYFKNDIFQKISNGTYSLIIDMLRKNIITSKEFYEITIELEKINYHLKIDITAYKYILSRASDEWISKVVKILNNYN